MELTHNPKYRQLFFSSSDIMGEAPIKLREMWKTGISKGERKEFVTEEWGQNESL